jgi:predicted GNAT family acetyltransferase
VVRRDLTRGLQGILIISLIARIESSMAESPRVVHDPAAGQFAIRSDAGVAMLTYVQRGDTLDLMHTRVPSELEGHGYGGALAKAALDYARANGLKVIPTCPFVSTYLRRHKEYADLVQVG